MSLKDELLANYDYSLAFERELNSLYEIIVCKLREVSKREKSTSFNLKEYIIVYNLRDMNIHDVYNWLKEKFEKEDIKCDYTQEKTINGKFIMTIDWTELSIDTIYKLILKHMINSKKAQKDLLLTITEIPKHNLNETILKEIHDRLLEEKHVRSTYDNSKITIDLSTYFIGKEAEY